MKTFHGLVVEREDLIEDKQKELFELIDWQDFKLAKNGVILPTDVVIFVDINLRTKLIKNRFGAVSVG